jgi:hypothetical protein
MIVVANLVHYSKINGVTNKDFKTIIRENVKIDTSDIKKYNEGIDDFAYEVNEELTKQRNEPKKTKNKDLI